MSSRAASHHTPPLPNLNKGDKRQSRRESRDDTCKQRRRSVTDVHNRYRAKRETYRSRSRHRSPSSSPNTGSSSWRARKRNRRYTSTSSSSHTADSGSYVFPSKRRRRRHSISLTVSDTSIDTIEAERQSRTKSRSNRRKRKTSKSHSKDTRDLVKKLVRTFKNDQHFEGAQNVIPEFNPDSDEQSSTNWINKVNETAKIYKWSERQVIFYAIPKLAGYAKKWYQGLSSVNLSWKEWQRQIIKTFPDDRNYADRLSEMLERRSRREETLEEYFHDKARLVRMCNIIGRNAVDCIVHGIFDNNIRLHAQGSCFQRPIQLLRYIRRISTKQSSSMRKSNQINRNESNTTRKYNDTLPNRGTQKSLHKYREPNRDIQCYNCLEIGHTSRKCTVPAKHCEKCRRLGHDGTKCEVVAKLRGKGKTYNNDNTSTNETTTTQKVLKISSNNQANSKYYKSIVLNGVSRSGYIDFGSQCTLICKKIAEESCLPLDKSGLPVIKGFALGSIIPLGKTSVNIVVDAVEADIEAYVVDDHLLDTDILIGQSLTELPTVVVHKTSSSLVLYCDDTETERTNLFVCNNVTLKVGLNIVDVRVDTDYSGPLFVPGSICMKPNNEYIILQGIYQFNNSKSLVFIVNMSQNVIDIKSDKLVARAIKLPNKDLFLPNSQTFNVNNVTLDNHISSLSVKPKSIIQLDMLNIGPKVTDSDKNKLLTLLNDFRDCFALEVHELGLTNISAMNHGLNEKDWDLHLDKLQWSLNNTINKGTGKSPAEIVFGQKTIGSAEGIVKGALDDEEQMSSAERDNLRATVQENIENNQSKMKDIYDKHRAPAKIFQEGDLVMIPNNNPEKGKSKKLAPRFRGPFKVTRVLGNDRYEVTSIQGHSNRTYQNIYPADHMKPWITMGTPSEGSGVISSSSDESHSE